MKIENQTAIIGGIFGFTIGTISMFFVQTDKELNSMLQDVKIERVIIENINTCEDIIEWMGQDKENYSDSTVFDSYIWNLEDMAEENRNLLYTRPETQNKYE
tara:strand:- start:514 stop:819 length:306 start_codon:yes stop_codon:yes gene_type:complete